MKSKQIRNFIAMFLAVALCLSATVFAAPSSTTIDEAALLQAAQPVLAEYEKHYDIDCVSITVTNEAETENGGVYVEYFVGIKAQLKYNNATELPQIRGLAKAFNIDSKTLTTQEFVDAMKSAETISAVTESVSAEATALAESMSTNALSYVSAIFAVDTASIGSEKPSVSNKETVARAIAEIATTEAVDFVENIETLYIGEVSTINIGLFAEFDRYGNLIDTQYVVYDGYTDDITAAIPSSVEDMIDYGIQQAHDYVTSAVKTISNIETIAAITAASCPTYYKLSARDYAKTWTSNPAERLCTNPDCSNYNKTIRMDTKKYNNSVYNWYCCNDCSNFVSQAMFAGGIPTDDKWKPGLQEWTNCYNLLLYFRDTKGWLVESTVYKAGAGDLIMMYNSDNKLKHVAMITLNDTVTRTFSAHTNDRLDNSYLTTSTFGYTSVKYYGFSNWVVEYAP